jgi:gamma-glutamylputrescine oxidase
MSIWSDALPPPFPKPPRALRAEVAVVGGGFAGLSAALALARRGARVVLLEANRLGSGASGKTTGLVGPGVGGNLASLIRRQGEARAAELYRRTLDAVAEVEALVARERIDCELEMSGQLLVAGSQRRVEREAALLYRLQLPGSCVDHPWFGRALRLPRAGTLHPGKLIASLAQRFLEAGGTIYEGARVREKIADQMIICTNRARGRILPLHLQVVSTSPLPEVWGGEGVVEARRVFRYFRLTRDRRLVLGGGAPRYQPGGAERALVKLERDVERRFGVRVEQRWTGTIGYSLDQLPAIRRQGNVLYALGWSGHGVALALAAGEELARLASGDPVGEWGRLPRLPPEPFRWIGFHASALAMELADAF